MEIQLSKLINPQPKQKLALETLFDPKCKYLLYGGSMSSGKSYVLRWASFAFNYYLFLKTGIRGLPVGLFSEDYPTLKDRQISRIEREFPKWIGELKEDTITGLAFHIAEKYGGGKILLRNLDDPSKYMSTEFAGEFVEELSRNPYQTFEDLRNRLRYPSVNEVKFMGATNPGGVGHGWVKKYFIDKNSDDIEQDRFFFVPATAYDNKYISPEYLKQLESLPTQQRKAYLDGSFDVFAGQYFPEFERNIHTVKPFIPKRSLPKFGGLDWGRARPFAFLTSVLQKVRMQDGRVFHRLWITSECYGTEKSPEEWTKEIHRKVSIPEFYSVMADPSIFTKSPDGGKSIAEQFMDADPEFKTKLKPATNDRISGWELLHQWLSMAPDGLPYLMITESCPNLIRTLPEAVHDDHSVEDVDSTGEDHALDALRYMVYHIKWIDGKIGSVQTPRPQDNTQRFIPMIDPDEMAKGIGKSRDWKAV